PRAATWQGTTSGRKRWSSRRSESTSRFDQPGALRAWLFTNPAEAQRKPGKGLNGRSDGDYRSEGAAIVGVRRRGDAARLAQEGRRAGLARREPDRYRDRQGRARAAG